MLGDPSRFSLAVFGIEAAFQPQARFFVRVWLLPVVARTGTIIRCNSIPVAVPRALLPCLIARMFRIQSTAGEGMPNPLENQVVVNERLAGEAIPRTFIHLPSPLVPGARMLIVPPAGVQKQRFMLSDV